MPYEDSKPQFERLLERVLSDKKLTSNSKSLVKEHIAYLQAQGRDTKTLIKHLYCLRVFVDFAEGKVDFKTMSRKDIERIIAKLEGSDYKPETRRNVKSIIKAFWRHFAGSDEYYPREVRWIRTTLNRKDRLLPEELLTEEDVLKMLDAANNARDKAVIAVLFDAGIRIGELLSMRRKDVDLEGNPAHITVSGKTGMRKIPILFSVPYLATYLNEQKMRKPDEYLWNVAGSWAGLTQRADYSAIRMMLQRVAAKAQIDKNVHPHLFRHSRASDYAKRLSDQELKSFFGWVGGSRMAETYVHLSGKDIDNSVLQANGYKPVEVQAPKLKVQICPRCHLANGPDALYCVRCGSPLSIDVALLEEKTQKAAIQSAIDPQAIAQIVDALVEEKLKERKKGK
jgi:site-specific recombinase XerD/ribosomal protein L40E